MHFADVGNLQGGQGYNAAIDNPPEEIRTTSETPEMPREKLKDINASYAVIESDFDDQREQPYRDTSNHPSRTLDYSRTQ